MRKVLVVDDNADFLDLVEQDLASDSFRVITYLAREDDNQIVEEIKSERPDLLLLDVYLRGGPAVSVSQLVRKDPELRDLPIYFISFAERSEVEQLADKAPVDGCLSKPIRSETIKKLLKKHYNDWTWSSTIA